MIVVFILSFPVLSQGFFQTFLERMGQFVAKRRFSFTDGRQVDILSLLLSLITD